MQGYIYLVRAKGTSRYKIETASSREEMTKKIERYNSINSLYPLELIYDCPTLETSNYVSIQIAISNFRTGDGWYDLGDSNIVNQVIDLMAQYSPSEPPVESSVNNPPTNNITTKSTLTSNLLTRQSIGLVVLLLGVGYLLFFSIMHSPNHQDGNTTEQHKNQ